jgi:hypothetical protein
MQTSAQEMGIGWALESWLPQQEMYDVPMLIRRGAILTVLILTFGGLVHEGSS